MLKITHRNPSEIKPYWRNPRNNQNAVKVVRESIQRFGFLNPILVDEQGVIIAGHTRYAAAIQMGLSSVPCVTLDLDAKKAKEYRIVDNKTNEFAEWDYSKLIPELRELDISGLQTFFKEFNLTDLIAENSGTKAFEELKQFKIDGEEKRLKELYQKISEHHANEKVEVTCPGCGMSFFLDKKDSE